MGGEAKQYQVVLDPKRLAGYRLSLGDVEHILERNNAAIGGGYIEKNRESFVIRGDAQFKSLEDIDNTVVTSDADGTPVLLKHLGEVQHRPGAALRRRHQARRGRDRRRHRDDADRRQLARRGARGQGSGWPRSRRSCPPASRSGRTTTAPSSSSRMLKTVAINLAEGAVLVVVVLFLTLGSFRGSLIAALAIPLSMGIAVHRHGAPAGHRQPDVAGRDRLRPAGRRRHRHAGGRAGRARRARGHRRAKTSRTVVAQSMRKAARPVTFALLIILLVYLPLMALEGVEGRMFQPMAITVALALVGALLFSLTAFPALAAFVLRAPKHAHDEQRRRLRQGAQRPTTRLLAVVLERPKPILALAAGGAGAGRAVVASHAGRRVRAAARRGRAVARHQAAAVDLDHRGAAAGRRRSRRCWRASPRCCRS